MKSINDNFSNKRVFLLLDTLLNYRVPFINKLSAYPNIELTFFYSSLSSWRKNENFKEIDISCLMYKITTNRNPK